MTTREITVEEWCQALESGTRKQTTGKLYDPVEKSYCCLGLLCRVGGATFHKTSVVHSQVRFLNEEEQTVTSGGDLQGVAADSLEAAARKFRKPQTFTVKHGDKTVRIEVKPNRYATASEPWEYNWEVFEEGDVLNTDYCTSIQSLFISLNDEGKAPFALIAKVARKILRPNAKITVATK